MLPHPLFGDPDVSFVELLCPLYEAVQKDENPVGAGEIKNAYEFLPVVCPQFPNASPDLGGVRKWHRRTLLLQEFDDR